MVERKHQHLLNVARALRFQANLPLKFWGDCILTATYLINRTPSPFLQDLSPYEKLLGNPPTYSHLRVFGCLCFASTLHRNRTKFDPRAKACIFLGYPFGSKGYKLYDLSTKSCFISRDVVFRESVFPFKHWTSRFVSSSLPINHSMFPSQPLVSDGSHSQIPLVSAEFSPPFSADDIAVPPDEFPDLVHPDQADSTDNQADSSPTFISDVPLLHNDAPALSPIPIASLRRSNRPHNPPTYLHDYHCNLVSAHVLASASLTQSHESNASSTSGILYPLSSSLSYSKLSTPHRLFSVALSVAKEPNSYAQALKDPLWQTAMKAEIDALQANHTWVMTKLPPGKVPIGCKWVYKVKLKADGSIERYKARLVAKGFTQTEGVDFYETFSPVVKFVTVRTLLVLAAVYGWHLTQLDVNNAFLHGDLDEEVYMLPPPGFGSKGEVCRLTKSLYGLKQASRQWFAKLSSTIVDLGFIQSKSDYSVFTRVNKGSIIILLIYVDDILIASNDVDTVNAFKQFLDNKFKLKDLGTLKYFLGLEVARTTKGLSLCQRKYTLELLSDTGLLASKPAKIPMEQSAKFSSAIGEDVPDPALYRRLIGKLLYLTLTRPDICYAVHKLSQFMTAPKAPHLQAVYKILKYLKGSPGQGLFLSAESELRLKSYCDADWQHVQTLGDQFLGFVFFLVTL